jgi:hypothetical protein
LHSRNERDGKEKKAGSSNCGPEIEKPEKGQQIEINHPSVMLGRYIKPNREGAAIKFFKK